jgi:hypothetical protein
MAEIRISAKSFWLIGFTFLAIVLPLAMWILASASATRVIDHSNAQMEAELLPALLGEALAKADFDAGLHRQISLTESSHPHADVDPISATVLSWTPPDIGGSSSRSDAFIANFIEGYNKTSSQLSSQ